MTRVLAAFDIEAACHVIAHMRQIDRDEIYATPHVRDEVDLLAAVLLASEHEPGKGQVFTFYTDAGVPVALMGWTENAPGLANVWCFGTDDWQSAILSMTKNVHRVIVPELIRSGVARAECAALASRADTAKWLPMLGLKPEAVLAGFGHQREDFILYVWNPENVRSQRQISSPDADGEPAAGD
jgi:hypothetical protein